MGRNAFGFLAKYYDILTIISTHLDSLLSRLLLSGSSSRSDAVLVELCHFEFPLLRRGPVRSEITRDKK